MKMGHSASCLRHSYKTQLLIPHPTLHLIPEGHHTMAPAFPIELCYSIIQNVNAVADLLVLSLCCSEFRKEAQRLLFRHPVTSTHEELMLFILAICSDSSRFGPLVHTFTMEYNPGPNANVSQDTAFIAYALSSMYNLMQVEHYASLLLPPKIYTNCKASSESFNYYGDSKTTLDISSLVYDVLPTQASLTHIIMDFTGTVRISPKLMKAAANLCPNLISLSVKSSVIGKMLLQRKKHLQSLQWLAGTSTPIGMTVLQYNHLSYLMLLTLARGLDTSFAQHLSSLALLEICFNPGWDTDILLSEVTGSKTQSLCALTDNTF